ETKAHRAVGEVADVEVLAATIFVETVVGEHWELVADEAVDEVANDCFGVLLPLVQAILGVVEVGAEEVERRRSASNALRGEARPIAVSSGSLQVNGVEAEATDVQ